MTTVSPWDCSRSRWKSLKPTVLFHTQDHRKRGCTEKAADRQSAQFKHLSTYYDQCQMHIGTQGGGNGCCVQPPVASTRSARGGNLHAITLTLFDEDARRTRTLIVKFQ
eukprot:6479740-Amphidinium_carterae.1